MKNTLEKILDDYSNELKYDDLYNLFKCLQPNDNHVNELMKRAYNQALEDVKENVTLLIENENEYNTFIKGNFAYISESGEHFEIDKESIDKLKIK